MTRIVLALLLMSSLPVLAHDGTAGEHLILGIDTGLVVGIAIGFAAGVGSAILYLKKFTKSSSSGI
jgi:hypothetical protein